MCLKVIGFAANDLDKAVISIKAQSPDYTIIYLFEYSHDSISLPTIYWHCDYLN